MAANENLRASTVSSGRSDAGSRIAHELRGGPRARAEWAARAHTLDWAPRRRFALVLAALVAAGASGGVAHARAGDPTRPTRPVARATRITAPPVIDGRLDEDVWRDAPDIGPFVQMEPRRNGEPSERTEIRILCDDEHVYLGVRCFDREPELLVGTQMRRDADLDPDDRVEILIDTFRDRRNAYFFQMSPVGSKGDALVTRNGGGFNKPWDGIWEGKSSVDASGWSFEVALPTRTLTFDPENDVWGFNANRAVKRRNEFSRWAALGENDSFFQISEAGDVHGLAGLEQGLGLDVVPFFAVDARRDRVEDDGSLVGRPGLDAFYRLSPSLGASFTWNTDFAETEVDDRRINLTRFPLFFPEKRAFFLREAGVFEFGDGSTELLPFFSRRVGLVDGEVVPIDVGGKLTGRAGDWNVGLLGVRTGATHALDAEDLVVARVSRDVGEQSSVGAIVTSGDPRGRSDSRVVGVDGTWRTSHFLGRQNASVTGFALASAGEGSTGQESAFGVSARMPNDEWTATASAREVGDGFDPRLGFVRRVGVREYGTSLELEPRLEGALRRYRAEIEADVVTDLDDRLETGTLRAQPVGLEFDSGDEVNLVAIGSRERFDDPFEIQDDVFVPGGEYDAWRGRVEIETAAKRPWSTELAYETGAFYDGTRDDVTVAFEWRPGPLFTGRLEYERSDVDLDGGSFTTHVGRSRLDFVFTPDVSWSNFVQFDNGSDSLGWNSRLRWILEPGRDLFLVFDQTVAREDGSLHPRRQSAAFKIAYTLRF